MAWPAAVVNAVPWVTAAIGGLAGSMKDQSESSTRINIAPEGGFEKQGREAQEQQFQDLLKILGGQSVGDIQGMQNQANQAQSGLDKILAAFAQAGGRPTSEQVTQAQTYAGQIFQPEQVALQQAFQDQAIQANQQAARMGRSAGDPILRARLAQDQTRQQAQLAARQGAYAADYAQQIPGMAISSQEALMNLRQGIAGQAMQNRLNLLNLGNQIQAQERQFRLATAGQTQTNESGGGLKGFLSGALGGFGAGAGAASSLGGLAGAAKTGATPGVSPGAGMAAAMAPQAMSYSVRPGVSAPQFLPPTREESAFQWVTQAPAQSPNQFLNWLKGPKYEQPIGWGPYGR